MPAPQKTPIVSKPSPVVVDQLIVEQEDSNVAVFDKRLEYGHRHHDHAKYPNHHLLKQGPDAFGVYQRVWGTTPVLEDTYNAALDFAGDSNIHPAFARAYRVLRSDYLVTGPATKLTAFTGIIAVQVSAGGTGYTKDFAVTFTGGAGSGATGLAIVDNRGAVIRVEITSVGSGYTSAPVPVFTGGSPGVGAAATAKIQPTAAILTTEKHTKLPEDDPYSSLFDRVVKVWETLPGVWIPDVQWNDNLGFIQLRRRSVVNSGQIGVNGATGRTTYKARDESSVVSWEIEERWSDGTGTAGNPAYPILVADDYEDERGPVQGTSQLVVKTGSEVGSLVVAGGIATKTTYVPFNEFLLKRIVETYVLAQTGRLVASVDPETKGTIWTIRTQKEAGLISTGAVITGGNLVVTERKDINAVLGWEVVTTIFPPAANSLATALTSTRTIPFQFPGRISIPTLDACGTAIGYRQPSARLTLATIKTYWVISETKPTLLFDEIIPNTIVVNDVKYDEVLHDATTRNYACGNLAFAATTPSYTQYVTSWVGQPKVISGEVTPTKYQLLWKVEAVFLTMR